MHRLGTSSSVARYSAATPHTKGDADEAHPYYVGSSFNHADASHVCTEQSVELAEHELTDLAATVRQLEPEPYCSPPNPAGFDQGRLHGCESSSRVLCRAGEEQGR